MNVAPTPAPQPDLTAGSLLSGVIDLLRKYPVPLLLPFIILGFIGGGGSAASTPWMNASPEGPDTGDPDFQLEGVGPELIGILIAGAVVLVLIVLVFIAVLVALYGMAWLYTTRAALMPLQGEGDVDVQRAVNDLRGLWLKGVGTYVLWGLAIILGLILLIAPGVIAMVGLTPWAAVVVIERRGGLGSLERAWALTRGHRVDLFLLFLLGFAATLATGTLAGIPFIGGALEGAADGVILAAAAVLGALFYVRRTATPPAPEPDEVPRV